jgi:ribosomal protein L9
LLESFLPPTIQFTRPTIAPNETTIHGSISTADICSAVRAIANASGEEASRVVVTPDMMSFLNNVESDKVKTLGEHPFEIRFKGAVKPVIRKVVIAQQISLE